MKQQARDRESAGGLPPTPHTNVPAYLSPAMTHLGPACQLVVMVRRPPFPSPAPKVIDDADVEDNVPPKILPL